VIAEFAEETPGLELVEVAAERRGEPSERFSTENVSDVPSHTSQRSGSLYSS
jgi:hypothetical protein